MDLVDLAWDEDAWNSYQATAVDEPGLHAALSATLTDLAHGPGDFRFRRRRMQRPPLFIISVSAAQAADWVILWNESDAGVPQIWFVGIDPF